MDIILKSEQLDFRAVEAGRIKFDMKFQSFSASPSDLTFESFDLAGHFQSLKWLGRPSLSRVEAQSAEPNPPPGRGRG